MQTIDYGQLNIIMITIKYLQIKPISVLISLLGLNYHDQKIRRTLVRDIGKH